MNSTKGGVMVQNDSESSFEMDVNSKQVLDPILVEFKESAFKKFFGSFSQAGDGVLRFQDHLCVLDLMV